MVVTYYFLLLSLVYITNCDSGYLPPYITPCDYKSENLSDCVKEQIEIAIPDFARGIPEMDVSSTDPVKLQNIVIDGNSLKLTFSDGAVYGYGKSKLTDFKIDLGEPEGSFIIGLKCNLKLISQYSIDGNILLVPIQGNGDATINIRGVELYTSSKIVYYKDDSGTHVKLATPSYNYTVGHATFDLKNLFNGNQELAEVTLKVVNENWQQVIDELSPPVVQQIVKNIFKIINKFFSKVTMSQMFKGYPIDA